MLSNNAERERERESPAIEQGGRDFTVNQKRCRTRSKITVKPERATQEDPALAKARRDLIGMTKHLCAVAVEELKDAREGDE